MTLKKLTLKAGTNQENTRYTNENGWWETQWVRFRQGTPEKIGGYQRASDTNAYVEGGICRSLWSWYTPNLLSAIGAGWDHKFTIFNPVGFPATSFNDITPVETTSALLPNPIQTTSGSNLVTIRGISYNFSQYQWVTISGATSVGGVSVNDQFQIQSVDPINSSFTIQVGTAATSTATGGGASVFVEYQVNAAAHGGANTAYWSQNNFGDDLVFGYRGGPIYYWEDTGAPAPYPRAVLASSLPGASDVPEAQNLLFVSDISRFVFAFGTTPIGGGVSIDPMLIRWSDQESVVNWTPSATTQAGDIRLSHGSAVIAVVQTRQEILVWTDAALYSLQYVGLPAVWQVQLLADNISIISQNAAVVASGVVYWMGVDKFYRYDGRTQTLRCDLRQKVFSEINMARSDIVFAGTNEGFNEVWFFYPNSSQECNNYVIFNYAENAAEGCWYYGVLQRSAWVDSGINQYPIAAATAAHMLVFHEYGVDDNTYYTTASPVSSPIESYVSSAEFDIDDGDRFGFVWRILPDITFRGSTRVDPFGYLYLIPMQNSGSGYNNPPSVAGADYGSVVRTSVVEIEQFTGQIYVRVRGRQMVLKFYSYDTGVQWQLGSPRIDIRPDGRR